MDDLEAGFLSIRKSIEKMAKNWFGDTHYCLEHFRTNQGSTRFLLVLLSGDSVEITLSRVEMMLYQRMEVMRLTIDNWIKKRIESELTFLEK